MGGLPILDKHGRATPGHQGGGPSLIFIRLHLQNVSNADATRGDVCAPGLAAERPGSVAEVRLPPQDAAPFAPIRNSSEPATFEMQILRCIIRALPSSFYT